VLLPESTAHAGCGMATSGPIKMHGGVDNDGTNISSPTGDIALLLKTLKALVVGNDLTQKSFYDNEIFRTCLPMRNVSVESNAQSVQVRAGGLPNQNSQSFAKDQGIEEGVSILDVFDGTSIAGWSKPPGRKYDGLTLSIRDNQITYKTFVAIFPEKKQCAWNASPHMAPAIGEYGNGLCFIDLSDHTHFRAVNFSTGPNGSITHIWLKVDER